MMQDRRISGDINEELAGIRLNETLRTEIAKKAMQRQEDRMCRIQREDIGQKRRQTVAYRPMRAVVLMAALFCVCVTTAFAAIYIKDSIHVNETVTPALDEMTRIQIQPVQGASDAYGTVEKDYDSYAAAADELGIHLLDTSLESANPYRLVHVETDNENYLFLTVENYLVGDVTGFEWLPEDDAYSWQRGAIYASPVHLRAEMILSDEQMTVGLDKDYLGYYSYSESYTSEQGWRVHIIRGTESDGLPDAGGRIAEKKAVFVADGIRYELTGRVSTETLKAIVDGML